MYHERLAARPSRRELLRSTACGFGGIALSGLLAQIAQASPRSSLVARPPHFFPSRQTCHLSVHGRGAFAAGFV